VGAEAAAGEQRFAGRSRQMQTQSNWFVRDSLADRVVMAETSMSTWRADMIDDKIDTRRETFMHRRKHG
jgi:hypothetical protein